MGAITLTYDESYLRVGVDLSGWAVDGPVTVSRVHADGSRNPVRGMSAVSGGAAFGWDYEAPLNVPVTYEAWDGVDLVTSSSAATVPVHRAVSMLTVPGLPAFGGVFEVVAKPTIKRARPQASLNVIGRVAPIVKSDVLKAGSFQLQLRTYTDAEAYFLMATLGVASVMLLRIPGTRVTDWCYVSIGDVEEVPDVYWKRQPGEPDDAPSSRAVWSFPCQIVESPVGGVFGDPTATYQASLDQFPTYEDRLNAHATYLDALKG